MGLHQGMSAVDFAALLQLHVMTPVHLVTILLSHCYWLLSLESLLRSAHLPLYLNRNQAHLHTVLDTSSPIIFPSS